MDIVRIYNSSVLFSCCNRTFIRVSLSFRQIKTDVAIPDTPGKYQPVTYENTFTYIQRSTNDGGGSRVILKCIISNSGGDAIILIMT